MAKVTLFDGYKKNVCFTGKHIRIRKPKNSGSEYFNYKKFFSIVLLALVDSDANFLYVDIGTQGSLNDAIVLKNSNLYLHMTTGRLNIPQPESIVQNEIKVPYFFVGDGGFALHPNLMKPYNGT